MFLISKKKIHQSLELRPLPPTMHCCVIFQFYNFRLTDQGGCCIYYNEPQLLADIEEHLGVTIQQVGLDIKVSVTSIVEFLMS